jgi:hypothetical protein
LPTELKHRLHMGGSPLPLAALCKFRIATELQRADVRSLEPEKRPSLQNVESMGAPERVLPLGGWAA